MDRTRRLYEIARGVPVLRMTSVLVLVAVSALIVFSVLAAPDSSPRGAPGEAPAMGWLDTSDRPDWTPISTSTDISPLDIRIPHDIEKQHLFVSRVRVRNPEFDGLYVRDLEDNLDYLQGGGVDIAFHAVTDLVGVVPRGRYYIGETGAGESSNWLVDYEDLPLLIRTGDVNQVCIKPWNWFQQGQRDAFLEIGHGESGYHDYSWPPSWRLAMSDTTYPGLEPTSLHSRYNQENRPYAFGHDRDEIFMREGAEVLFRDVAAHSGDMPSSVNLSSLCGASSEIWREYSDSSLYRIYLESNPGRYEWRFAGMSVDWVYVDPDKFDLNHVPYAELPAGTVVVSPEMVYSDMWPRMAHPTLDDSEKLHEFDVLDRERDAEDRSFRRLPDSARGDIDDVYGDGRVEIIESSVNPEDVCREFSVQINAIEYTPTYVAGGVEAHCLGAGANYNHLPLLIRDTRIASMHPFFEADDETGECDPQKPGQVSRECFDLNVGIEGRVMQRRTVYVYVYYRIYEQRYDESRGGWQDLDPGLDTLVTTNDPAFQSSHPEAYRNAEVRLNYVVPDGGVRNCDYRLETDSQFDRRPDDMYMGAFKVDLPPAYRVSDEDTRKKRFGVYLEVDMVHQIEIGGTEPGRDYRIHGGTYDDPGCGASALQVGRGLWNYSGRKLCADNSENCELWMGPPARWKSFDLFRPTVTPVSVPE